MPVHEDDMHPMSNKLSSISISFCTMISQRHCDGDADGDGDGDGDVFGMVIAMAMAMAMRMGTGVEMGMGMEMVSENKLQSS